ncbi:MAG: transporter substrate-binding domain-containing protein [Gracilibacteraceae bacterium]|jgi:L-cystine transport system substrate-binding protein|nr:transporter substrate-binding domain-containing protein [Gracilibacteraceae bacterium]
MKHRIAWPLLISTILALSACGGGGTAQSAPAAGGAAADAPRTITLAVNSINAPYSYLNDKDELLGYNSAVLAAIDELLPQYVFEYAPVSDTSAIQVGTETGKYQVGVSYYFKNPTREEKFLFPENPYGYSNVVIISRVGEPAINSLAELAASDKIQTPQTTSGGIFPILEEYNRANPDKPVKFDTIDVLTIGDSLNMVADERYDVALVNHVPFLLVQKELNLDTLIAGKPISHQPFYFLVNKSETQLNADISEAVKKLTDSGVLARYAEEHLGVNVFET